MRTMNMGTRFTNPEIVRVAREYNRMHGLSDHSGEPSTLTGDAQVSRRTAEAYERMAHTPNDPAVKSAYDALRSEISQQWHGMKSHIAVEPWDKPGQPYANSKDMSIDVAKNRHLWYFPTSDDQIPHDHPLAGYDQSTGLRYNDMFRAVHDYFGHAMHGHQFGPVGEQRAWHEHSRMFTPLAQRALTTETHGQNSWVNFGPHSNKPVTERPYAEQKAGLLPDDLRPVKLSRSPDDMYPPLTRYIDDNGDVTLHHFTNRVSGDSVDLDPKYVGAHKYTRNDLKVSRSPRLFFYTDPEEREPLVAGDHYVTKVPGRMIYDLRADEHGLVTPDLGRTLAEVAGRGYKGVYYNTGNHGVVNWWEPITAQPVAKLARLAGTYDRPQKASFETPTAQYNINVEDAPEDESSRGSYGFTHRVNKATGARVRSLMFEGRAHDSESRSYDLGVTGFGHAKHVFTHVVEAVHDLMNRRDRPPVLEFSADRTPSRNKLYNFLTSRAHRLGPDYHGFEVSHYPKLSPHERSYYIVHSSAVPHVLAAAKELGHPITRLTPEPTTAKLARKSDEPIPPFQPNTQHIIRRGPVRATVTYHPSHITLERIEVQKARRGEGHGAELMRELLDHADRENKRVFLTVHPLDRSTKRARLQKWYESLGFEHFEFSRQDPRDEVLRRIPNPVAKLSRWMPHLTRITSDPVSGSAFIRTPSGRTLDAEIYRGYVDLINPTKADLFHHEMGEHHNLQFGMPGSFVTDFRPTGSKTMAGVADAAHVTSDLVELLHDRLHNHTPLVHYEGVDPKQTKLYRWLTSKVQQIHPEYSGYEVEHYKDSEPHFYLVHDKDRQRFMDAVDITGAKGRELTGERVSKNARWDHSIYGTGDTPAGGHADIALPSGRGLTAQLLPRLANPASERLIERMITGLPPVYSLFFRGNDPDALYIPKRGRDLSSVNDAAHTTEELVRLLHYSLHTHRPIVEYSGTSDQHKKLYRWLTSKVRQVHPEYVGYEAVAQDRFDLPKHHFLLVPHEHADAVEQAMGAHGMKHTRLTGAPVAKLSRGLNTTVAESMGQQESVRLRLAKRILREAGVRGHVSPAIYLGPSTRSSVNQLIQHTDEPDTVRYLAAWYGLMAKEPKLTVFHEGEGNDTLHMVVTGATPEQIHGAIRSHGIPSASHAGGRVYIYDQGSSLTPFVKQLASSLHGTHSAVQGTGHQIGGSGSRTDANARTAYRTVVQQFESQNTN